MNLFIGSMVAIGALVVIIAYISHTWGATPLNQHSNILGNKLMLGIFGVVFFAFWLVPFNEIDRLSRACYDNNISVSGYEEQMKQYKIDEFRERLDNN